tara:strand:+ start:53 stop:301 length:249 start_codon:yes stop_codon:yes gene_type:complete
MPRRKKIKPTPHKGKYNKFIKVQYEQIGKRKSREMEIPVIGEITINSPLEPLIAKKLGVETADIWVIDEPYMVTNMINKENE